ncbi:MAG: hypothetical protein JWN98_1653 [Abditibacteriota bacterium]|nr:hypothetical protein [Abditibacteriota bacterium]
MSIVKPWHEILISPATSIRETIRKIDSNSLQIALVVEGNNRLAGTVTDGDVRRGILRGVALDDPVRLIMNPSPITARHNESEESILATMKLRRLHHIPVVDGQGCIVDVEVLDDLIQARRRDNWVMLMAGGLGTRLAPLTDDCPKPLLKVGSKPLLETIIENFVENGFRRFYVSVNYKY